jgi:hypothetical protein
MFSYFDGRVVIADNNRDNNSIQIFILMCWLNSYKSQLQSQHKNNNVQRKENT